MHVAAHSCDHDNRARRSRFCHFAMEYYSLLASSWYYTPGSGRLRVPIKGYISLFSSSNGSSHTILALFQILRNSPIRRETSILGNFIEYLTQTIRATLPSFDSRWHSLVQTRLLMCLSSPTTSLRQTCSRMASRPAGKLLPTTIN